MRVPNWFPELPSDRLCSWFFFPIFSLQSIYQWAFCQMFQIVGDGCALHTHGGNTHTLGQRGGGGLPRQPRRNYTEPSCVWKLCCQHACIQQRGNRAVKKRHLEIPNLNFLVNKSRRVIKWLVHSHAASYLKKQNERVPEQYLFVPKGIWCRGIWWFCVSIQDSACNPASKHKPFLLPIGYICYLAEIPRTQWTIKHRYTHMWNIARQKPISKPFCLICISVLDQMTILKMGFLSLLWNHIFLTVQNSQCRISERADAEWMTLGAADWREGGDSIGSTIMSKSEIFQEPGDFFTHP